MAKDFFGWSRWSPHVGNAITIVGGVPIMSALGTAIWAYLSPSRGLEVALVALAAFMMTLWCCIGYIWITDRRKQAKEPVIMSAWDCAWAIRITAAFLVRDLGPQNSEWQIFLHIRNSKNIPIKIDIVEQKCIIENMVPDVKLEIIGIPHVIGPYETFQINYPSYRKGVLPDKDRFSGEIDLIARYGYPDSGYSRIVRGRFSFNAIVRPTISPGLPTALFPVGGAVPLPLGLREEYKDEPYSEVSPALRL